MANAEPFTAQTVAAEQMYSFTNSVVLTRCFVKLGKNGQWYLSLKNNEWVFQPEQYGNNKFLWYKFQPSTTIKGYVVAQIQGDKLNGEKKTCISTQSATKLEATTLSQKLLKGWISANPVLFLATSRKNDARVTLNQDSMGDIGGGRNTLESLMFPGHYFAYDSTDISPVATSIPVILVKKGDRNWDNRFLTFV